MSTNLVSYSSHRLKIVSWLHVWELTRIDFGGHSQEVVVRGSVSQICSEVCKVCVSYVPPESTPVCMVGLLKYNSQHSITTGAQQLRCWGLFPDYSVVFRLRWLKVKVGEKLFYVCLIMFFGKLPVISIFNFFFFYFLWFTLWSYEENGLMYRNVKMVANELVFKHFSDIYEMKTF